MENNIKLQLLASRLNLTKPDDEPEEYILTKEEEDIVIRNAIEQKKKHKEWNLTDKGLSKEVVSTTISGIDWNERIDREDVLKTANSNKLYSIWHQQQREKDKANFLKQQGELLKRCDAKYFYNLMAWASENNYGKKLICHEDNTPLIKTICFFLSNDKRFETEMGYSFNKGLLIRGVSGLGKTFLLKCVSGNDLNPIDIISMVEISEKVKDEGSFEIYTQGILYLDDVGTEEHIVNYFGSKINWFKNFIELYYLNNKPFDRLIISTNNNFQELEEKYGFRVRSRIKDMFNIIDVVGKDMRG